MGLQADEESANDRPLIAPRPLKQTHRMKLAKERRCPAGTVPQAALPLHHAAVSAELAVGVG